MSIVRLAEAINTDRLNWDMASIQRIAEDIYRDIKRDFPDFKAQNINGFSDLHDYCDANEYLLVPDLWTGDIYNGDFDVNAANAVMDILDGWIKENRLGNRIISDMKNGLI